MAEYKQADFCKVYGLEASTVSKAVKRGALQKNTAGMIDDENTLNKVFLAKRRFKTIKEALADDGRNAERLVKKIDFTAIEDYEIEDHTRLPKKLLGMTIRDLVIKYKGMDGIERYVKMLRDLAGADEKDQKTQERRLQLVEKDFITARVFQYIDDLMKRLLEWPEGEVDKIISLAQSEGAAARRDIARKMEEGVSGILKDAKTQIAKELSGLRAKYKDDDKLDEIKTAIEDAVGG